MCSIFFVPFSFSDSAIYFTKSSERIGGTYWKVQYTEYTDESFSVKKTLTEDEVHLGLLGIQWLSNECFTYVYLSLVEPTPSDLYPIKNRKLFAVRLGLLKQY